MKHKSYQLSDRDVQALVLSLPYVLDCPDISDGDELVSLVSSAEFKLSHRLPLSQTETGLAILSCRVVCEYLSGHRQLDVDPEDRTELSRFFFDFNRLKALM